MDVVQLGPVFVTERWDVDASITLSEDLRSRIDASTWRGVAVQLMGWFDWEYSCLLRQPWP